MQLENQPSCTRTILYTMLLNNIFSQILIIASSLFLFISCANVRQPTGGPMDEKAPEVKSTNHKNFKTNFKETELVIVFSEPIQVDNIAKNFFISPKVENQPKIKIKKRSIKIQFQDTLEANTTYTLTFLNAIQDLTEKNTLEQYKYIFSTGNYIDSLDIKGQIIEPFTGEKLSNILVSLYLDKDNDTNTVSNSDPIYFTYTNKEGLFEITNIKNGVYNIYAIKDENQNQQFNYGKELIDFEEKLQIDSNISNIVLYPTKIDTLKPRFLTPKSSINQVSIEASEGLKKVNIEELKTKKPLFSEISSNGKMINIYNTDRFTDSLEINIVALDTANNKQEDTLKILFLQYEKKDSLPNNEWTVNPGNFKLKKKNDSISFTFNYPISYPTKEIVTIPDNILTPSTNNKNQYAKTFTLNVNKAFKDTLTVYLPDELFKSPMANASKADTLHFTIQDESEFGSIEGSVETSEKNYILQLLNSKKELLEEKYSPRTFLFTNLKEGQYYLRIIGDTNNNKQWDQANLIEKIKAENIYILPDPIRVKENWEIKGINIKY
jgi:uncharacterized protein (DUF2141 family)